MPADINNAFDIAFWFLDTAEAQHEYLQPQKLQRLMFIAQAYYAVAFQGRKLMPAVFVADELGPIEANVYVALSKGRADIDTELFLPIEVEDFLSAIWRRFGHFTPERLNRLTNETTAYKHARARGARAEITIDAMRLSFARAEVAPAAEQVVKPKVYRTQTGKPVQVSAWQPGMKAGPRKPA